MAYINGRKILFAPRVNITVDGGSDYLAEVMNKQITELINNKITTGLCANFQSGNTKLKKVDLENVISVGESCFHQCTSIDYINLPKVTTIASQSFSVLNSLKSLYLPSLETITGWGYTMQQCINMEKAYFPNLKNITLACFHNCRKLKTLILGSSTVCTLDNTSALTGTPIAKYTEYTNGELGYVYVPKSLVDSYKAETNWSSYASQIRAIEDYPAVLEGWE